MLKLTRNKPRQRRTGATSCAGGARLILAATFFWSLGGWAQTPVETQLKNGLKLLVLEDHRAPVVVSQLWYKVGSSYEYDGITGVSHVLEHMLFKGTQRHGPGEFSRIVAESGGRSNAFTGNDYTTYFQQFEKSHLSVSFELEADRMRNATLDEREFAKEIKVVMEERRLRTEDNPKARARELLRSQAYQNSPYRHPIIGWMADLETMKTSHLRGWYDQWYAPNNAVLVVTGDVDAYAVKQLAEAHFGQLSAREVPVPRSNVEAPQRGAKRATLNATATVPRLTISYKAPSLKRLLDEGGGMQSHAYALTLLSVLLANEQTGLLVKKLVRDDEIASDISVDYDPYTRLDSLFTITATPALGRELDVLEHELRAALVAVSIDDATLARAKMQLKARDVYQRDSLFYRAMQLGILETVGLSWRERENYLPSINAINAKQIQAVISAYLTAAGETLVYLIPETGETNGQPHSLRK